MYEKDGRMEALGVEIIDRAMGHLRGVSISFLNCDRVKRSNGKIVYADCEKLSEKASALSGVDFVITFYRDAEDLSPNARRILMEHELKHVGWDGEKKYIIPHDVDDFRSIIEKYGIDWTEK